MLVIEFISCSFLSIQTKDENRRRRDSRSRISEEVAGWLPPISRYSARKAADRLARRKHPFTKETQENHVFTRIGLVVQEPIPDSLKRAFLESRGGVDLDYGDSCTAAIRSFCDA